MRSLNNLQERFHQSFFFYLLPATNRYISIGTWQFNCETYTSSNNVFIGVYMPPFGLMMGAILLQAIALYISRKENQDATNWNFLKLSPMLILSFICGLLLHSAPEYLTQLNRTFQLQLSTEDTIFGGFALLSIAHLTLFSTISARLG